MLQDETITEPRHFKNEHFKGTTTLDYNARGHSDDQPNLFESCTFEGNGRTEKGGHYAISVPLNRRPLATLRFCDVGHADKAIKGQALWIYNSDIHDHL
jgi:hypothetical protein